MFLYHSKVPCGSLKVQYVKVYIENIEKINRYYQQNMKK